MTGHGAGIGPCIVGKLERSRGDIQSSYTQLYDDSVMYVNTQMAGRRGMVDSDTVKMRLADFKKEMDSLRKLKAIRNEDIKEVYDKFNDKSRQTVSYVESFLGEEELMAELNNNCSSGALREVLSAPASELLKTYDRVLTPCTNSLEEIAKSSNKSLSAYGTSTAALYKELRSLIVELQSAIDAKDSAKELNVRSKISAHSNKSSSVAREIDDNMKSDLRALDAKQDLRDLKGLLSEKSE